MRVVFSRLRGKKDVDAEAREGKAEPRKAPGRERQRTGGPRASSVPEDVRAAGAALREAARDSFSAGPGGVAPRGPGTGPAGAGATPPEPGRRRGSKKPRYSDESAAPTYRPQGSLVPEPVPSAANLPAPEKLFGRKRNAAASATFYAILLCAVAGALLLLALPLRYWLTSGTSAAHVSQAASASTAVRQAEALAVPFATAYLEIDPNDTPDTLQARVSPFLDGGLSPDVIAQQRDSESTTQHVLSTAAYETQKIRRGRWAVYTESVVDTTSATGSADGSDTNPHSFRRVGLEVFVGEDASGAVSVVAPPHTISARRSFRGEPGAIAAADSQSLSDGPVKNLLQGYFAAAYGSSDSRAAIANFLAPGASAPPQPASGLKYLGIQDGVVYQIQPPRGSDYTQIYDVEAYVSVQDPRSGTTSTQTHVLRVGETQDGWKVIGGPGVVGS